MELKTDSYPVESNVHFPTDINLLWDSGRKCFDTIEIAINRITLKGWRKLAYRKKQFKKKYRRLSNIHRKKGGNYQDRLREAAEVYLLIARELNVKIDVSRMEMGRSSDIVVQLLETTLAYYQEMLNKHIDLIDRRILKGEKIPHKEKLFSIFESHVEWIQKGKANNKVELGHNVLITTDQYQFILDHKVMVEESDSHQPIALMTRLKENYKEGYKIQSISFDRGFYSRLAKASLETEVDQLIMPSKGRQTEGQKEESKGKGYIKLNNKHSAVESNINELEHAGVDKVPDKGLPAFKRYVAMGVLAYNIRRLGRIVIAQGKLETLIKPKGYRRVA